MKQKSNNQRQGPEIKNQESSLRWLADLTKSGIVVFVVFCTLAGYVLGYQVEQDFSLWHLLQVLLGTSILSAGSFVLNQIQEVTLDRKMPRTSRRPLVSGKVSFQTAWGLTLLFLGLGLALLYNSKTLLGHLGLFTVILYNLFYTMYWKRNWIFAAVPGAIPGAMPVVIGYAANNSNIFSKECMYGFLIMFLWQMPHYWSLAIRFADDYKKGGVPTLPVAYGSEVTLFQIGLYTFVYTGLAIMSPWFVEVSYLYLILVIPFSIKVIWEFIKYFKAEGKERWLSFFLWTNVSMLVFLMAAAVDKWIHILTHIRA